MKIFNGPSKQTGRQWFEIKNQADTSKPVEVLIYDDIGETEDWWTGEKSGVGAEKFINQLKALGDERAITLGINSRGGNVWDGMAIYNYIRRRGNVDTRNDGLAASIASLILIGGRKVSAPRASQVMIHDPATIAFGGEDEMEKAKQALASSKRTLIAAYKEKTGKSDDEIAEKMKAETWFTGEDAKAFGFVDDLTESQPIFNSLDLSCFKRVPEALRNQQPSAADRSGAKKESNVMDRNEMIALLKERGIQVSDSITDVDLKAKFKEVFNSAGTQTATQTQGQRHTEAVAGASAPNAELTNRLATIEAKYEAERKTRITGAIDNAISERRIVAAQRDSWIARALKDETILTDIAAMPQQLPPEGVGTSIEITSDALTDVAKHIRTMKDSAGKSALLRKHHARFVQAWHDPRIFEIRNEGTNTIDTTLKQDVLMDQSLRAFAKVLVGLSSFSTKFENVALRGTNKIQVPYFALQSAASTAWNAANGYVGGDTATDNREVTIDKRYYQAIRFTADEIRRQPYLLLNEHMVLNGQKLAYDVWLDILSAITIANFATAAYANDVTGFDSDDLADLNKAANDAQWPMVGRSLFLNSAFDNQLKKDNALKNAFAAGGSEVVRQGIIPNVYGFDYVQNPNIPTNGQDLAGFIAFKSALLIATAPIAPLEEELRAGLTYQVLTDPDLGISMEVKSFGDPQMNRAFRIIECNYGYGPGEAAALQRIRSTAGA